MPAVRIMAAMKVIATYSKPEEAHLAAALLEGSGVAVNVRDADTVGNYWMYSNAVGGVSVVCEL